MRKEPIFFFVNGTERDMARFVLYVQYDRRRKGKFNLGSGACVDVIEKYKLQKIVRIENLDVILQKESTLPEWLDGSPCLVDKSGKRILYGTSARDFLLDFGENQVGDSGGGEREIKFDESGVTKQGVTKQGLRHLQDHRNQNRQGKAHQESQLPNSLAAIYESRIDDGIDNAWTPDDDPIKDDKISPGEASGVDIDALLKERARRTQELLSKNKNEQ